MGWLPLPEGGQMGHPAQRFRAPSCTTLLLSSEKDVTAQEAAMTTDEESPNCLVTGKGNQCGWN